MYKPIEIKLPLNFSEQFGFYESYIDIKDSIKQNLKCLFLTSKGERVRDTDFGIGIYEYLFEINKTPTVANILSDEIARQIAKYTPYITIEDILIKNSEEKLYVKLLYIIPKLNIRDTLSLEV